MATISFRLAEDGLSVEAVIHDFAPPIPNEEDLIHLFRSSEFSACKLLEEKIPEIMGCLPEITPETEGGMPTEAAPTEAAPTEAAPTEAAPEQAVMPLAEPLVFPIAHKLNAVMEVMVSDDLMQAAIKLTTAQGGTNYVQADFLNRLQEAIAEKLPKEFVGQVDVSGIKGLNKIALARFCSESLAAEPGAELEAVLVEGLAAEEGIPTEFNYLVTPLQERVLVPKERDDGSVDMHDLGEIETVKEGDQLVRRIPSRAGANGFNIIGQVIPSVAPENLPLMADEGSAISDDDPDLLVATLSGVPLKIDNGMGVSDVLVLDQVNLSVGNIDFDGVVIVKGDVAPKMEVKATKDVVVDGFAESCFIQAGGDITVRNGVIGHEEQKGNERINLDKLTVHLISDKDIHVRYAQAAHLVAKQNIYVASQLLHCDAVAGEAVMVGDPGQKKPKLVGGRIHAKKVAAGELGAPSNSRIVIDFSDRIKALEKELYKLSVAKEEKEVFRENINQALRKLQMHKKLPPELEEKRQKIIHTLDHVNGEIKQIEEEEAAIPVAIEAVRDEIHADVYGQLYPGIEFIICSEKYRTRNEVPTCTVRFRKRQMVYDRPDGKSTM